jgi:hypothetical protein
MSAADSFGLFMTGISFIILGGVTVWLGLIKMGIVVIVVGLIALWFTKRGH